MAYMQNLLNYKIFIFLIFLSAVILFFYFGVNKKKLEKIKNFYRAKMTKFEIPKNNIVKVKLDNGMNILIFKNDSVPKVLVQIAYDIGSYVEQEGERGLAHLIEHMIFKGTDELSETDIDTIAKKYGATLNAYTSKDITSYFFEADKNNWKPFIGILADCMQNARFDEQHLASELKTVIQELRMYKDYYWRNMLEKASEIIFPTNHPYHRPVIGYKEDLMQLSAQNLKKFYKEHYSPDHATLFIVGDIDIDEVISFAKEKFGNIKGTDNRIDYPEKYFFPIQNDLSANKTVIYEDIQNEQLGFYWLIPGLKEKTEVIADVVEFVLGEGQGSRLHKRLVDEEKVATGIGVMAHQMMESGEFLIFVEPIPGKSEDCRKIIQEEIAKLINDGISEKELQKIVKTKRRAFFQELQSLSGFTNEWIQSYLAHKNEFALFEKINEFNNVDSDNVQEFATLYLDPFLMNQIEILPIPESKRKLWEENKKKSDELDQKILSQYIRTTKLEEPRFEKTLPKPNKLEFNFPKPTQTFTLNNGLDVIVHKDSFWPIFSFNLQFKEAEFLSESKDGILLSLLMAMLTEGSIDLPKEELIDFFETRGASVSLDESGVGLSGLSEDMSDLVSKLFYVMTNPDFSENSLDKLKIVFIDSFNRAKDSSKAVALNLLKNEIYRGLSYDWTFDQAIEILSKATIKDLQNLHKKLLSPENMILSVAGEFEDEKVKVLIEKTFTSWSGEKFETEKWHKSEFRPNDKIDHSMLRDQVVLYFGKPSSLTIYDDDLIPVKILNLISFSSLGSRLLKLREQTGIFYTATGTFAANATRFPGYDFVGTVLSVDKLDEAEKLIKKLVDEIGKNGIKQSEIDAAKQQYLKTLIDLTASNEAIAMMLARLKSFELGFDYYDKVLNRIQRMGIEELNEIASKYFNSKDFARVRVGRI
ncbi:MAG: pitrilysin family protein [bacterium]